MQRKLDLKELAILKISENTEIGPENSNFVADLGQDRYDLYSDLGVEFLNSKTSGREMSQKNSTIWTSHRGYCLDAAENTLGSFEAAKYLGFCSFETDLRPTKDDHLVLCHDLDFSRLSGPNKPVSEMTRLEVESVDLSFGCKPLFFDQFIDSYAGFSWIFDIKPEFGMKTIELLKIWIDSNSAADWFFSNARFLFWSEAQQSKFSKTFPNSVCLANFAECWRAGVASVLNLSSLSGISKDKTYSLKSEVAGISLFQPRILNIYRKKNAKILAYLPRTDGLAKEALNLGFDEILTNELIVSAP